MESLSQTFRIPTEEESAQPLFSKCKVCVRLKPLGAGASDQPDIKSMAHKFLKSVDKEKNEVNQSVHDKMMG